MHGDAPYHGLPCMQYGLNIENDMVSQAKRSWQSGSRSTSFYNHPVSQPRPRPSPSFYQPNYPPTPHIAFTICHDLSEKVSCMNVNAKDFVPRTIFPLQDVSNRLSTPPTTITKTSKLPSLSVKVVKKPSSTDGSFLPSTTVVDSTSASRPLVPTTSKSLLDDKLKSAIEQQVQVYGNYPQAIQLAEWKKKQLPISLHPKFYHELAGYIKRQNMTLLARLYYAQLVQLDPNSSMYWLEFARLEEELGQWQRCGEILHRGLIFCESNVNLFLRVIKHEEFVDNVMASRTLLARIKTWPLKRSWKILMEGALLEARVGNYLIGRKIFHFMRRKMPQNGPVIFEASLMEERHGNYRRALAIVLEGIKLIPRYGLLWLSALRLYERMIVRELQQQQQQLYSNKHSTAATRWKEVRQLVYPSKDQVCKEFVWKIFFEYALMEQRYLLFLVRQQSQRQEDWSIHVQNCRQAFGMAIQHCPDHLTWKVWLAGARMEFFVCENVAIAKKILAHTAKDTQDTKSSLHMTIEEARLEEIQGHFKASRSLLATASKTLTHDEAWKIHYEHILLECRMYQFATARVICIKALAFYPNVGRLWSIFLSLHHDSGFEMQLKIFKQAIEQVPKSGEVWCEGARLYLNPFASFFNLDKAEKYLEFAAMFTPQYGDVFIEMLRVRMLRLVHLYTTSNNNNNIRQQEQRLKRGEEEEEEEQVLLCDFLENLRRKCINADPKYGRLWFVCKQEEFSTPREIFRIAKQKIATDLDTTWQFYRKHLYPHATVGDSSFSLLSSYHFTNALVEDCIKFWSLEDRQMKKLVHSNPIDTRHGLIQEVYGHDPILS